MCDSHFWRLSCLTTHRIWEFLVSPIYALILIFLSDMHWYWCGHSKSKWRILESIAARKYLNLQILTDSTVSRGVKSGPGTLNFENSWSPICRKLTAGNFKYMEFLSEFPAYKCSFIPTVHEMNAEKSNGQLALAWRNY